MTAADKNGSLQHWLIMARKATALYFVGLQEVVQSQFKLCNY
jgi:hypothetical protein